MKFAKCIRLRRTGWALCMFMAGAASVQAQSARESQEGAVPREFAQVLLANAGGEFRFGDIPENLPGAEQLAAGARVIGSVVWRNRSESAIAVREPVAEAREPFEARLRAAGWVERPEPNQPDRGFLPAYTADRYRGFCWPGTDAQLVMNVRRNPTGGSYILLSYYEPGEGRFCAAPPSRPSPTALESLMPSLRPPDGAEVVGGGGGGGGGNEYETRSAVTTSHTPAQLIRHFQPQLREQGWSIAEQLNGKEMAFIFARKKRDNGADLLLWVSAARQDAERAGLTMRIAVRNERR